MIKTHINLVVFIVAVFVISTQAFALPTIFDRRISWDEACLDCDGYFTYFASKTEPQPRTYDDSRKIDLADPSATELFLLVIAPQLSGEICIKLTAYKSSGVESPFAKVNQLMKDSGKSTDPEGEEVCGDFGFIGALNLGVGK